MSTEQNKIITRRFVEEVIGKGNWKVVDELVATNYSYQAPGMEVSGPDGIKQLLGMLRTAFPDWNETIEDLLGEGDKVVFRVIGTGTHKGDWMGIPPTGNKVTVKGIDIVRIEGDKLVEHWANFDALGMMQQLGVIPTPEAA
jgi:predicted ester cyclase